MARIIVYIVGAVVLLVLAWTLLSTFLQSLMFGFWIVLALLFAFALFRLGRWSSRRSRE